MNLLKMAESWGFDVTLDKDGIYTLSVFTESNSMRGKWLKNWLEGEECLYLNEREFKNLLELLDIETAETRR